MIIIEAYKEFWTKGFDFKGKTKRNIYWWTLVANTIVSIITRIPELFGSLPVVYTLACILPATAMNIRRLRDIGRAWQWIFLFFIPLLGPIILLIFFCYPSDSFDDYKPKQITSSK